MTWTTFHRRGDVLHAVTQAADERRDGVLPMDVTGVHETFGDELTLLAALQLRWHTRLSGHIERALLDHPSDLEEAVTEAWHADGRRAARASGWCSTTTAPSRSTRRWPSRWRPRSPRNAS